MRPLVLALFVAHLASAHAPILPAIKGPLAVRDNLLVDETGQAVALRGVVMPGLEVMDASPDSADAQNVAAMTAATFGVIRVRWNLNAVRLPVSVAAWLRDGDGYLDRVAEVVKLANDANLVVILATCEEARCGTTAPFGLPGPETLSFWRAWAARFKESPRVVFSIFPQPSAQPVPDVVAGQRTGADWQFWLHGGTTTTGQQAAGMQELVEAIRSTGAQQVIAVSAFHDALGFQELTSETMIQGTNIIYEWHPHYEFALSDAEREAGFGFLASRVPLYAGEWGLTLDEDGPWCSKLPPDTASVYGVAFETMAYLDQRLISWTAASFRPGSLIGGFVDYEPTSLDRPWTCGVSTSPPAGMGETVLYITTGDPTGFGYLGTDRIANRAGGPASPVAPGQLLNLFIEQMGPVPDESGAVDEAGRLPTNLQGTEVRFDGVAVPLLSAGAYQIGVQVPYNLVAGTKTTVQVFFRGVPSNRIAADVVEAAPELFHDASTRYAVATNEDGTTNSRSNPAQAGATVTLFASGCGQTSPAGTAGLVAPQPHPALTLPASVNIDGQTGAVMFSGEVPGFAGLAQVTARLPASIASQSARPAPVTLRVGSSTSRAPVLLWIR